MTDSANPTEDTIETDGKAAVRVFYDAGCPVCRREIGWYTGMRGAGEIDWVDVSRESAPRPAGFSREALLKRFTVERRDGRIATGAEGFSALWRALGPTRLLGRVTDRQPFRAVGEALYRLFLKIRAAAR